MSSPSLTSHKAEDDDNLDQPLKVMSIRKPSLKVKIDLKQLVHIHPDYIDHCTQQTTTPPYNNKAQPSPFRQIRWASPLSQIKTIPNRAHNLPPTISPSDLSSTLEGQLPTAYFAFTNHPCQKNPPDNHTNHPITHTFDTHTHNNGHGSNLPPVKGSTITSPGVFSFKSHIVAFAPPMSRFVHPSWTAVTRSNLVPLNQALDQDISLHPHDSTPKPLISLRSEKVQVDEAAPIAATVPESKTFPQDDLLTKAETTAADRDVRSIIMHSDMTNRFRSGAIQLGVQANNMIVRGLDSSNSRLEVITGPASPHGNKSTPTSGVELATTSPTGRQSKSSATAAACSEDRLRLMPVAGPSKNKPTIAIPEPITPTIKPSVCFASSVSKSRLQEQGEGMANEVDEKQVEKGNSVVMFSSEDQGASKPTLLHETGSNFAPTGKSSVPRAVLDRRNTLPVPLQEGTKKVVEIRQIRTKTTTNTKEGVDERTLVGLRGDEDHSATPDPQSDDRTIHIPFASRRERGLKKAKSTQSPRIRLGPNEDIEQYHTLSFSKCAGAMTVEESGVNSALTPLNSRTGTKRKVGDDYDATSPAHNGPRPPKRHKYKPLNKLILIEWVNELDRLYFLLVRGKINKGLYEKLEDLLDTIEKNKENPSLTEDLMGETHLARAVRRFSHRMLGVKTKAKALDILDCWGERWYGRSARIRHADPEMVGL